MRIVNTDNFCRDYPNEFFVLGRLRLDIAERIVLALNDSEGAHSERCYKVVDDDYILQPGFEP